MKKTFWLLDVNYEVKDHQPKVWIWGIDDEGKRILIIDRNFSPYFYLVIEEKENARAGPGRLYEKAKPHVLASYDEVDIEYYMSKQVVPVASRILSMFGVAKDELLPSKAPKTLLEFMGS